GLHLVARQSVWELWQRDPPALSPPPSPPPPPPLPPGPGYLGLLVDEARGEVRRLGKRHDAGAPRTVRLDTASAEGHTFLVAFRAGERGATDEEWEKGYPGGPVERRRMRNCKSRVKKKLEGLDLDFPDGQLRLLDLPPAPR